MLLRPTPGGILKRITQIIRGDDPAQDDDSASQHGAGPSKHIPENEYFTFSKSGELIDVDDDEIMELERKIEDNWRKAYLDSVQETDDER